MLSNVRSNPSGVQLWVLAHVRCAREAQSSVAPPSLLASAAEASRAETEPSAPASTIGDTFVPQPTTVEKKSVLSAVTASDPYRNQRACIQPHYAGSSLQIQYALTIARKCGMTTRLVYVHRAHG